METWERIRFGRKDLTDYVVHFTRRRDVMTVLADDKMMPLAPLKPTMACALDVLINILQCGYIRPSFALRKNRSRPDRRTATVKGPDPAVCLTEQPLSAILAMLAMTDRYSGYGIAYHKFALHAHGGRPVWYGTEKELGQRIPEAGAGWQDGKDVRKFGLPEDLQYLWVRYQPRMPGCGGYPVDFTWEGEWRVKPQGNGLPILLEQDYFRPPKVAILVEKDEDIAIVRGHVNRIATSGSEWARHLQHVFSLETAKRKLEEGDKLCETRNLAASRQGTVKPQRRVEESLTACFRIGSPRANGAEENWKQGAIAQ